MTDTSELQKLLGAADIEALCERLRKRAEQDRSYAVNNALVADLLQPQMDAFERRDGHNVYAVRMAVDHRKSAKRDSAWADDLESACATIARLTAERDALVEGMRKIAEQKCDRDRPDDYNRGWEAARYSAREIARALVRDGGGA